MQLKLPAITSSRDRHDALWHFLAAAPKVSRSFDGQAVDAESSNLANHEFVFIFCQPLSTATGTALAGNACG